MTDHFTRKSRRHQTVRTSAVYDVAFEIWRRIVKASGCRLPVNVDLFGEQALQGINAYERASLAPASDADEIG